MVIVPLTLKQANDIVRTLHRHHKPVIGHRFSLGLKDATGAIVGAAIVGRPVARKTPQYEVAEVTRLVTNGHKNACSALYGACARVAKEMGFLRIQTFILESETGVSLKAAGWSFDRVSPGGDWNCPTRGGRRMDQPQCRKQLWFKNLNRATAHDLWTGVI